MDPSYLSHLLQSLSQCNLNSLKQTRFKFQKETQQLLDNYQHLQSEKENHKVLQSQYEKLLKISQQSLDKNEKIEKQLQHKNTDVQRLQALKEEKWQKLKIKKQKLQQLKQRQITINRSQSHTQQIQHENQQLASKLLTQKQQCKQFLKSKKQLKSLINLIKNQKSSIQTQRQKTEHEYRMGSTSRYNLSRQVEDELQMMKKEIMQMKYQLVREQQSRVKRNKVQTLTGIREMIRKHREGMKE